MKWIILVYVFSSPAVPAEERTFEFKSFQECRKSRPEYLDVASAIVGGDLEGDKVIYVTKCHRDPSSK